MKLMQIDFYKFNGRFYFETDNHEGRVVISIEEHFGEKFKHVSHLELDYDIEDEEYDILLNYMRDNINEILNAKSL